MLSEYADHWNALLEFGGSLFICLSIRKILQDKLVRGISWLQVAFWTVWGFSNLIYYPAMGSWWSFYAGMSVTLANTVYVSLLVYYTFKEDADGREETRTGKD